MLNFCGQSNFFDTTHTETENSFENPEDIVDSVFKEFYEEKQIPTERLTQEEKMELIEKIEIAGIFNIKGSISHIADKLMFRGKCVSISFETRR